MGEVVVKSPVHICSHNEAPPTSLNLNKGFHKMSSVRKDAQGYVSHVTKSK